MQIQLCPTLNLSSEMFVLRTSGRLWLQVWNSPEKTRKDVNNSIVGKTRRRRPWYISGLMCSFLLFFSLFFCENWDICWMNGHPVILGGGQTCVLMAFHAIFRQTLNYRCCAISTRELSVCAISYDFCNSPLLYLHITSFFPTLLRDNKGLKIKMSIFKLMLKMWDLNSGVRNYFPDMSEWRFHMKSSG